jgi:hypothetical protein
LFHSSLHSLSVNHSSFTGRWFQTLVRELFNISKAGTKSDIGTCSKGNLQLIVFSILNIVTDVMLIALPLPQLIKIKRPLMAKIRLIVLFLVGLTIVAVTLTRLLMNLALFNRAGESHNVANVELFFEAFVANASTIYGLLHIESRQRSKHEYQNYSQGVWKESKSANGEAHHTVRSRVTELSWRQPKGNESDEEMIIVRFPPPTQPNPSTPFPPLYLYNLRCCCLRSIIGIIGKLQPLRFTC